jgi:outer membrane protein TolC
VRSNYPYYQGNHYYSHTTSGTNAFGFKVPIYVYVTGNEAVYRAKAASDQALQKQGQARDALINTVNEAFRAYIEKEPEDLSRRILWLCPLGTCCSDG